MKVNVIKAALLVGLAGASTSILAQAGPCSDPQINTAFATVAHRAPNGSGTSGECNPANYYSHLGKRWASQTDLNNVVRDGLSGAFRDKVPAPAPSPTVPASATWYVDASQNLVANTPAHSILAPAGSYSLLNPDGSSVALVAAGGGNLVAAGGGNLVAAGGGNIVPSQRTTLSVGSKRVFIVKR